MNLRSGGCLLFERARMTRSKGRAMSRGLVEYHRLSGDAALSADELLTFLLDARRRGTRPLHARSLPALNFSQRN